MGIKEWINPWRDFIVHSGTQTDLEHTLSSLNCFNRNLLLWPCRQNGSGVTQVIQFLPCPTVVNTTFSWPITRANAWLALEWMDLDTQDCNLVIQAKVELSVKSSLRSENFQIKLFSQNCILYPEDFPFSFHFWHLLLLMQFQIS